MTRAAIIGIIILLLLGVVGWQGYSVYNAFYTAPVSSPKGVYTFDVETGDTSTEIAKMLAADNVVTHDFVISYFGKGGALEPLQSGTYTLNLPATPQQIITQLNENSNRIQEQITLQSKENIVSITFKEGDTLDKMIQKLVDSGISTKSELEKVARNTALFTPLQYNFLPEPLSCTYGDLKTCAKYYLEGYLYPDTYQFFKNSTPEQIYQKMLNNFDQKVWSRIPSQKKNQNFNNVVVMASVIQAETGRTKGVTTASRPLLNEERSIMAGVFNNRLNQKMRWQSDVTASYGHGFTICQQTFDVENCKFLDDPVVNTKYNTYNIVGYPIGPINSPEFDTINATLNPTSNDYLFFVADGTGKKYFSSTEDQHLQTIERVNQINRELGL